MFSPSSRTPYLLTGVSGGLGTKILSEMLHVHHIPPSSIIATSRNPSPSVADYYTSTLGTHFRLADYTSPPTLLSAFQNVENLLFISSSTRDSAMRIVEHKNVIEAAKEAGVGRVWYVSLAFGGYESTSQIGFQQAHYETERMLVESGMEWFVSLRVGVYTDAFPLFLNWYPSSEEVLLPRLRGGDEDGKAGFTMREEIGEGVARLLVQGLEGCGVEVRGERRIVLLTARERFSLVDIVEGINRARREGGQEELGVRYLEPKEWIEVMSEGDLGGKGRDWFEARLVFLQGVRDGDAATTSDDLKKVLGREPEAGLAGVERLIKEAGGEYYWHQNHVGEMPRSGGK